MIIYKQSLLTLLLGLCFTNLNAQSNLDENSTHSKKMYIGLGGSFSTFQDLKYSSVRYSGIGAVFNFGFNRTSDKSIWELAVSLNYSNEKAGTHSSGVTPMFNPNIYFKYLWSLNNNFYVGGRIDAIDLYARTVKGLGNNSSYLINGHHFYGSAIYKKSISDNWSLQSSLDIGLLSFMRESTSFGFSAPQNGLENGEFNYQNEELESPFGYKYYQFKHIANNLNVKTSFMFNYKKRLALGYSWEMRHFANVKSYPVTTGLHNIIIRYNITKK